MVERVPAIVAGIEEVTRAELALVPHFRTAVYIEPCVRLANVPK